jgi:hypothetical protein
MIDNTGQQEDTNSIRQATLVESTSQSADAKLQVVENKLRQISQLIETIKSGSKHTEEVLRKEIDTLRTKQDKIDKTLEISDLKKTLDKLAPALKAQAQTISNQLSMSNTSDTTISQGKSPSIVTVPLQKAIQQFANNQGMQKSLGNMNMPFGGFGGMNASNVQLPNIFSTMQGFMQPGNRNMQNLFPSLIQGFLGGKMGHMSHMPNMFNMPGMRRMPFGGMNMPGMNIPFRGMSGKGRVEGETRRRSEDYSSDDSNRMNEPSPSGQIATPIPMEKPSIGGYGELGKTSSTTLSGVPKEPSKTATQVTGKSFGWWTPQRQQHAVDRLMKEGKLSEMGARGLVSRWAHVEAAQGPSEVNSIGATGIGQWLGARKKGLPSDFDGQITHAINELNTSERRAGKVLRSATTPEEGARGASIYERAEGYDPSTGTDNFTNKTLKYIPSISGPGNVKGLLKAPSLAGQEPEKKSQEEVTGNIPAMGKPLPDQKNRPYHYGGKLTVGEHVFPYGTGGSGRGSQPYGTVPIRGIHQYGYQAGESFELGNKDLNVTDPKYPNAPRSGTLLHSSSGNDIDHILTSGCIGIPRRKFPEFKKALLEKIKKEGPQYLTINRDGTASINPHKGETTQSVEEFTKDNKNANAQPKTMDKLSPEGKTINAIASPDKTDTATKITKEPKEYTSKNVLKELNSYQQNLDSILKKQEEKVNPSEGKQYQEQLTPEGKEQVATKSISKEPLTVKGYSEAPVEPLASVDPKLVEGLNYPDLRSNQLKQFAMDEKISSKAPAKPEPIVSPGEQKTQDRIAPKSINDILTRNKPEQHESASVKPSWKDEYTIPSKAGNSRVEKSYMKPSTGADASFSSASTATSQ